VRQVAGGEGDTLVAVWLRALAEASPPRNRCRRRRRRETLARMRLIVAVAAAGRS